MTRDQHWAIVIDDVTALKQRWARSRITVIWHHYNGRDACVSPGNIHNYKYAYKSWDIINQKPVSTGTLKYT